VTQLPAVRVVPYGERAYLVELDGGIDEAVNDRLHQLAGVVERATREFGGGEPIVEGYASLLVPFDPDLVDPDALRALLERLGREPLETGAAGQHDPVIHRIPVRYGGLDGPDLEDVAERTGLGVEAVIDLHSGSDYRVFMLGFAPGFGYLGPLPEALRLPRRAEPRLRVPAGSVAIAGAQTAVYPHETAAGWHILGRTDERLWDPRAEPPARLRPGDRVHFVRT